MALQPITFPTPGFLGVNKAKADTLMGPEWATEARNCVVDGSGRIAARKGWLKSTTTPMTGSPTVSALHEYTQNDGTVMLIGASSTKLWHSVDNGVNWVDVTGAITTPTAGNWQFVNYNGKVFAAQIGHAMIVKDTTGNFAAATAATGTIPASPVCIWAAFGRLWTISSDYQTMKWCALLDQTKWATADGGGTQDLGYLWTKGTDQGVGINAFGSTLCVFGKRHIFLFTDGSGSDRGLDPSTMYVGDTIEGVGLAARDSLQAIGEGDLIFLSHHGIRTMQRTLQEKQTPFNDVSANNRDYIITTFLNSAIDTKKIRSCWSPTHAFYLLSSPDSKAMMCVDTRAMMEDGTYRMFNWDGYYPYAMCNRLSGTVVLGFAGGIVGTYYGYLDNLVPYRFAFHTGWLDTGDANPIWKMLKRMRVMMLSPGGYAVVFKWWFDFSAEPWNNTRTYTADTNSEYNVDEYAIGQYGGVTSQRIDNFSLAGSGQFFKLGVEVEINGFPFALQSVTTYFEGTRLA